MRTFAWRASCVRGIYACFKTTEAGLLQIGVASRERPADGPAELLLACHGRIRSFTALGAQLASGQPARDAEVADAARRVHRYFAIALPLHEADEELSIAPALARVGPPEIVDALLKMAREHVEIDALVGELLPRWESLVRAPGRRSELAAEMSTRVARLEALFGPHLAAEEKLIFPALPRLLEANELARIADEMRARRSPPASTP